MDRKPAVDWSVARCRPGRRIALSALLLVSVLGFSPRAEGDLTADRSAEAKPSAAPSHAHPGSAVVRFAASVDELIDPVEDDHLGSEPLAAPSFEAPESPASYGCLSAPLDSQSLVSSNPARGPPSS